MPGLLDLNPTHVKSQTCRHIEFICDRLQHPPAQRSTGVLASIYRESCCTVCSTLACAVTQPFSMQCIRSCDHQGTLVHLFVACIIVFVPSAQDMKQCSLEFSARTAFDFVQWSDCSFACETGPPSQLPCVRQCRRLKLPRVNIMLYPWNRLPQANADMVLITQCCKFIADMDLNNERPFGCTTTAVTKP